MGSLVWSTTGANSQGSSQESWLGPHSPSTHPHLPRGFSGPFQKVLGNLLPCPQPVLSHRTDTHSSPPPHPSSQHFLHLTASLLPLGSCHSGHRQLPSLWEPGPVITCGPEGLLLRLAVSLGVCRTSSRPGIRLVTSKGKRPRLLFSWLLREPSCWSQLNWEGLDDFLHQPSAVLEAFISSLGTLFWLPAQACYLLGERHGKDTPHGRRVTKERLREKGRK